MWDIAIVPMGRIFVMDSGGKIAEANSLVPSSVQGYRPNIRSLRWRELEVGEESGVRVGVSTGAGVRVGTSVAVGISSGVGVEVSVRVGLS